MYKINNKHKTTNVSIGKYSSIALVKPDWIRAMFIGKLKTLCTITIRYKFNFLLASSYFGQAKPKIKAISMRVL